jgi:hypothetical protein
MASSFTGSVTVANPAAMLNASGLALTPTSGPLPIGVLDEPAIWSRREASASIPPRCR